MGKKIPPQGGKKFSVDQTLQPEQLCPIPLTGEIGLLVQIYFLKHRLRNPQAS